MEVQNPKVKIISSSVSVVTHCSLIGFAHGKVDPVEAGRKGGLASAASHTDDNNGGSSGSGGMWYISPLLITLANHLLKRIRSRQG